MTASTSLDERLERWPLALVCARAGLVEERWVDVVVHDGTLHVAGCRAQGGDGDEVHMPLAETYVHPDWCACVHMAWEPEQTGAMCGEEMVLGVYGPGFGALRSASSDVARTAVLATLDGLVRAGRRWWEDSSVVSTLSQWCADELAATAPAQRAALERWLVDGPVVSPREMAACTKLGADGWSWYLDRLASYRPGEPDTHDGGGGAPADHWVVSDGPVRDGVVAAYLSALGALTPGRCVVQLPRPLAQGMRRRGAHRWTGTEPMRWGPVWDLGAVEPGDGEGLADTLRGFSGLSGPDSLDVARAVWRGTPTTRPGR